LEEQEFKLEVTDPRQLDEIADAPEIRERAEAPARTVTMRADYIDTPDLALLQAGYAYRVRQEGEQWVATVKADLGGSEDGGLHRHQEWEAAVADPAPDLTVFDDPALQRALGEIQGERPLITLFRVEMERRVQMLVLDQGSRAEWAADRGRILANGREEPVCEVELELKEGPLEPLRDLIDRLRSRYALRPDSRTKFARGLALAGLNRD
jgi:inorganic triphosphatase YgiF